MKSTLLTFTLVTLALAAAVALSACQSDPPRADNTQMGMAVALMIQAQTYDPHAAANPPQLAPEGADGQRLKNVVDAHRKDVPMGNSEVRQAPTFEAGKQQ